MNLNEQIYQKHIADLSNLNHANRKMIILFSGVPGSGKTTLAKKIQNEFNGVIIRNDDIRNIIKSLEHSGTVQETLINYQEYLFGKLDQFENKFFVIDATIDRSYYRLNKFEISKSYPMFIIQLPYDKEEIIKRIKDREEDSAEDYLKHLDEWHKDYLDFNKVHPADFIYKGDKDNGALFEAIERKLDS